MPLFKRFGNHQLLHDRSLFVLFYYRCKVKNCFEIFARCRFGELIKVDFY